MTNLRVDSSTSSPTLSEWPREPYKGLNYFSAADAPLFGQREAEIQEAVTLLSSFDTRVVLVHGCSGAGKSSFLRAGLCARLQQKPTEDGRRFFFLEEKRPNASVNDPLLIRATDDPAARIFETLREAAELESTTLSGDVRKTLRRLLAGPVPRNRLDAIPVILAALKALTAPPQTKTFVLVIDQAEEVLTLPTTAGADNVRHAFFQLIEQVCFRSFDLRLIVALRTEYYGRFCSYFLIRPTIKLTPPTEFGAGLMDYLLRPLGDTDIAAAIRQPTSEESRNHGLPPPRSIYGFSYEGELPEMIATDLLRQSGEASTLPAMQIVCKQLYERVVIRRGRNEITELDYESFGRAAGAIDSFMVRTLKDAATSANLPTLSDTDVDSWALVLSQVVGRAEGGAVQTLIANEGELIKAAGNRGIAEDVARAMLKQMVDPERRLLRPAGGEGGSSAYSLGHDSLGPSVLRRSDQAGVRAEAEKQRAAAEAQFEKQQEFAKRQLEDVRYKSRLRTAFAAFILLAMVGAGVFFFATVVAPLQERVSIITNYAEHAETGDFRLRLILLASALQSSDTRLGSLFVDAAKPRRVLENVLVRAPIYGGTFAAAAWDAKGRRVLRLENNNLIVHHLETEEDGPPTALPAGPIGSGVPPSIGFIIQKDGAEALAAFRTDFATLMVGPEGSELKEVEFPRPPRKDGIFIPRADIFDKRVRIVFLRFENSAITQMGILQLSGTATQGFEPDKPGDVVLDWQAFNQRAPRQPVLAEDCNSYAFLGRNTENTGYLLSYGSFGNSLTPSETFHPVPAQTAVAFARECNWIVARDESNLHVVSTLTGSDRPKTQTVSLDKLKGAAVMVVPGAGQVQPVLAAIPRLNEAGWRTGWLTADGLTIVDIDRGKMGVRLLGSGKLLTGLDPGYVTGSLSFSNDGKFALIMLQQTFNAPIQLRAFNLDMDGRQAAIAKSFKTSGELIKEACRIAAFQGNTNLTEAERLAWFGSLTASPPCAGT